MFVEHRQTTSKQWFCYATTPAISEHWKWTLVQMWEMCKCELVWIVVPSRPPCCALKRDVSNCLVIQSIWRPGWKPIGFRDCRLCGHQHCHHCWQHQGKVIVDVIGNINSILWQWWWVTAGGSSGFGSVVIIIHHFRGRWYHPHQLRHRRFPWHHHGEAVFNVVSDMGSKLHQWCCVVGGRGSGVG